MDKTPEAVDKCLKVDREARGPKREREREREITLSLKLKGDPWESSNFNGYKNFPSAF